MSGKFTQFGERTGHVDLVDWDLAVLKQTGALLDTTKNEWYLPLSFYVNDPIVGPVAIERALVVYKRPEPTQVAHAVPQVAILRDDIDPDERRLQSPTVQYRLPAPGATPVSVGGMLGFSAYETKEKEDPYILTYTIEVWARYKHVAQFLLQKMMRAFPIRGVLTVIAGEESGRNVENERKYLFFQEGIADLTEINSMVERIPGFSLTIRVEAELTLGREPYTVPAFTGPRSDTPSPVTPNNPELPAGGQYGTGNPNVRVTLVED